MPTAQLTFNLPEENDEFNTCVAAMQFRMVIEDMRESLRNTLKYGELDDKAHEAVQKVQTEFLDNLNDRGLLKLIQ